MLQRIKAFCNRKAMWIFLLVAAVITGRTSLCDKMAGESWIYTVYMDGRGYYAQLPAFFIYDDPSYSFYAEQCAVKPDEANFLNDIDGKPVNKYFCGPAFLQLPFFATAHLIAKNSGYKANGYTEPYFYSVAIAALFYYLLGLFFIWKLLEKFLFRKRVILFVCLCFAFGTNLFHYAIYEPSMSHIYSFAAVAGFLYFARCFFLSPSRKYILLAAISLAIVALLRPINLVVFFAFPLMAGEWESVKAGFRWIGKNILSTVIAVLAFLAICFVQLYVYHWQTGHFFIWAYRNEGFDFAHPNFFGTLLSYEKGLFVYTPLTLLALIGLVPMVKRSRYLFFSFLPLIAVIAWIVSSWHEWRYGYSFGLRAYVDYYALFALSMAFLVDAAFKRKIALASVTVVAALLITFYGIQQYQFFHRIIHPGAMDKEKYWLVFLKTDKKYQDTITAINHVTESDGEFNDMEGSRAWPGLETIVKGVAYSGEHSSRIDETNIYSCGFMRKMSGSSIFSHPSRLLISAYVLRNEATDVGELKVAQVKGDTIFFFEGYPLPPVKKYGEWQDVHYEVKMPGAYMDKQVLKVFFERKNGVLYVDDFKVEVIGE
jgi:hypothetical protein